MLDELHLLGFKPFAQAQSLKLAPITLVYGPNSAGKSSLMQALLLLKQSMLAPPGGPHLVARGQELDLGGHRALRHRHGGVPLRLGLSLPLPNATLGQLPASAQKLKHLHLGWDYGSDGTQSPKLQAVRLRLEGQGKHWELRLRVVSEAITGEAVPMGQAVFKAADASSKAALAGWLTESGEAAPEADWSLELLDDRVLPHHPHVMAVGGEEGPSLAEVRRLMGRLQALREAVCLGLSRVVHLGPLRHHPERYYQPNEGNPTSVGREGQFAAQVLAERGEAGEAAVGAWLSHFELPYRLELKRLGDEATGELVSLNLVDLRHGTRVMPTDVGFGVGQLLPIVVEALAGDGRWLAVEQPEIHLHPRQAAHLADLMIETAGWGLGRKRRRGRHVSWLVETHSEALMLRLQRRIREGHISAKEVSVVYVQPQAELGSQLLPLALGPDGAFLSEWPEGFFEEGWREGVLGALS